MNTGSSAGHLEAGVFPASPMLSAGIVAYNEEANLETAVRSLLSQELPKGAQWNEFWVVASGCTDRTVEIAESLRRRDLRVRILVEPDRGGKARALGELLRRASGDAIVLLNSDARAEPGSVRYLLRQSIGKSPPFAVMGRPVVPGGGVGSWSETLEWMWELHHEFHAELLARGNGSHLSDELLLVSLEKAPTIPPGIINDGAYFALWLAQHGGSQWYAPEARVSVQVPSTLPDHLRQRRRIHVGNRQLVSAFGVPPASVPRRFLIHPAETGRLLHKLIARKGGLGYFARVAALEGAAHMLGIWDRLPPRKDHVRWERIRTFDPCPAETPADDRSKGGERRNPGPTPTEVRIASLLHVAEKFGVGIRLEELVYLLPADGPKDLAALREWLEFRPGLARVVEGRAFSPTSGTNHETPREAWAASYRRYAEQLWTGPLSFAQGLARCVGITGSAAFENVQAGDDLDLFAVLRTGALWWFLARTYLSLHLARHRNPHFRGPPVCLNFVLEEGPAEAEFARRSDLIFAREALSVKILQGDDYYRGLVARAPWMRNEIPRLYDVRSEHPGNTRPEPARPLVRLLNALVYPWLASYLQAAGLVRNWRFRRRGTPGRAFRTSTRFRRVAFATRRFEQLRDEYQRRPVDRPRPFEGASGAGSSAGP